MTKDTISAITAILTSNLNVIQNRENEYCLKIKKLEQALERIRDCDWVITLPDRMDAVRQIAREALE